MTQADFLRFLTDHKEELKGKWDPDFFTNQMLRNPNFYRDYSFSNSPGDTLALYRLIILTVEYATNGIINFELEEDDTNGGEVLAVKGTGLSVSADINLLRKHFNRLGLEFLLPTFQQVIQEVRERDD